MHLKRLIENSGHAAEILQRLSYSTSNQSLSGWLENPMTPTPLDPQATIQSLMDFSPT